MVKIGINGFGRIGRLVVRRCFQKLRDARCSASGDSPQVVAVNDPYLSADHMANLLKYDSTHGLFQGEISVIGSSLKVDGQIVDITNEKNPEKIPWAKSCPKYVVDATGLYKSYDKASALIHDTVERVVLTYPSKDDIPMFVFGVNQDNYCNELKVVSNASCTTNCLAPLVKVIHDNFKIECGLMTTIHAITPSQNTLDGPAKKNYRIGRGALQNIIPTSTGAAKAIGKIIPEMDGKLTGIAARVPVADASMVDLTVVIDTPADYEVIKCKVKEAADGYLNGILAYTDDQIVSSDVIGDSRSSIFDAGAGVALTRNFIKLISWYDNEWGYACRVVDLLKYMSSRECDN
ncbi:glyceraldehyde-3-phosphate dehydrogenase [Tribolium castaneum]|uniref:Glyceraldehyde-3-phosphate dehydrogenase n=1 Tax=Tribolium castaneum TaxID=7070 RepID=D6WV87_TRICA|nr:PREDICTED: glyceraldehyde-3-phosphate dehydrogenase [Tribolium castaneum]EFA07763.1 Glyceraldehyde-3-phosphate dehydrogenase 2-like Protein [Tribolium castaneum]|eukprot:XP_008197491.1 PREDICTED: glyceraldehyde-3-phosphate dehydrogenase [Tribolium castaneum]